MSFNRVIILGNLGKDPVDLSSEQSSLAAFSIATHETSFFNGEPKKTTEWFDVVCFGKDADFSLKNLKKGDQVLIEGRLQARTYNAKDGTKVKAFEIKASTVQGTARTSKERTDRVEDRVTAENASNLETAVKSAPPKDVPHGVARLAEAMGDSLE